MSIVEPNRAETGWALRARHYVAHTSINPTGIVPVGPAQDLDAPHDRDTL